MICLLVFVMPFFSVFLSLFGVFWEASGALWPPFEILWGLFGVLVSPFWVPLARLGCFLVFSLVSFCDKGLQRGDSQPSFVCFVCFLWLWRWFCCFFHVSSHLETWSRPRRRRGRRPQQYPTQPWDHCFAALLFFSGVFKLRFRWFVLLLFLRF